MTVQDDHRLTENGKIEMRKLGQRMLIRLFDLLINIKPEQIEVRAIDSPRTIQSANEYINGMFELFPQKPTIESIPQNTDYLLRFADLCEKHIDVRNF